MPTLFDLSKNFLTKGLQTPTQESIGLSAKSFFEKKKALFERDVPEAKAEPLKLPPTGFVKETIKGLPEAAVTVGKAVGGFVGKIGQMIARNIGSAGVTLSGGKPVSFEDFPRVLQPVAKAVFTEEPIKSIESRIAEAEPKIKEWGKELKRVSETPGLETRERFVSSTLADIAEQSPFILAFAGVMGSVGIDLTPFGGLEKGAFRAMIKAKNVIEATSLLKKMGIADDLIKTFADDVVRVADEKTAKALFTKIANIQRTTKVAPKIAPEAPIKPVEAIPPEKGIIIGVEKVSPPLPKPVSPLVEEEIIKAGRGVGEVKPEIIKVAKEVTEEVPRATQVASLSRERGFIASVKETAPIKIAGQYIPRSTDDLAIKAKNLIKTDIATAEKMALTGTDDKAVATASELIKHYEDLATKTASKAAKNAFYDKVAEIAVEIAPKLTEQGRAIQAASILGRQTPEGQLRFAARTIQKYNESVEAARGGFLGLKKKVPELTGDQAESILTQMKKVKEMPNGVNKAMAFKKLQDEIADLIPSPWYKKIINLWKAGLLTGLKTSGLNDFSNLFHGVSEMVKEIPAEGIDRVVSLFTKERTIAFTLRGIKGGGIEGFQKGIRYMKTGFDERNVAIKLDWRRVSFGKSKFAKMIQTYEETVFHLMGVQDQPFYYGAKARSLASQAIAKGKNAKLKGKELQKFVQNLIENPTDEMLKYATNDAEMSVFQNRTLLGDVARGIQKIPGGEVVVPFGRTPSAVAMQIVNYSPVGIVKTIVNNIGKGKFDQRLFSQGIGRGIVGTGAMFIGMQMFKNDLISLDYPTSEREKNQWQLEGRKPNSFKTPDGKWRSVLPLGPAGMLLILGGQLQKSLNDTGNLSSSLLEAGPATAKSFTEQTFLVGINQFAKALNDPGRYAENVAARTFGSTVPTIVSDVARSIDPLERRTYAKTEGFVAPFVGRVPGLRQTLEPTIDVFGSPLARMGNALETMLDPSRPTRIKSSKLIEELRRLFDAGFPATPTRFADEKTYTEVLTPEQITYLQERAGLIIEGKLTNLIEGTEYKKLDDDAKSRTIQNFTNQARVTARAETIEELVQGLEGEEFDAKMSKFKNSGFMTQQVFNKWRELFR